MSTVHLTLSNNQAIINGTYFKLISENNIISKYILLLICFARMDFSE